MTQQLFDFHELDAVLQQMSGEGVPEGVWRYFFGNPGLLRAGYEGERDGGACDMSHVPHAGE